jgi:uncharacterized protein YyaL (SSP411 family)
VCNLLGTTNEEKIMARIRASSTYSWMDELMASAIEPMPKAKQRYQLTRMYQGLHAIETDKKPTIDDWSVVADAINLMEVMIRDLKICTDGSGLLEDATQAMKAATVRWQDAGMLRLDGAGIKAVRAVLEDYADILAVVPHRTMINVHRATEKRLIEIRKGKKQPHDVVLK